MADLKYATDLKNDQLDQVTTNIDQGSGAGTLRIYSGSPPTNPGDAATGSLLAELTMSDPSASAATSGTLTFSSITADSTADNTGTAGYFRIVDSNATVIVQGDVTGNGGGGDIELDNTSINAGQQVSVTSLEITGGN